MKNPLFNMKSVIKGSYKANVGAGAGAETFCKSEPEPERKQKVSAPQRWFLQPVCMMKYKMYCGFRPYGRVSAYYAGTGYRFILIFKRFEGSTVYWHYCR